MGLRTYVIVLLVAACGGRSSSTPGQPAPAAELFPEAPASVCAELPLVGSDVEFVDISPDQLVAIEGTPTAGAQHCIATNSKATCSKRCEAGYVISIAVNRRATAIELAGLEGCQGNDCRVDCKPFGARPETAYRFVGSIRSTEASVGPQYRMIVTDFCSLSSP